MKKIRKALLPLFMAMLISALFGTVSMAASSGTVAKIGSTKYTSLEAAFKAAKNGQTIVLQKDVSYSSVLSFSRSGKSVTLNLNKHTITFKKSTAYLYVKKGTLTVKNGTVKQTKAVYDEISGVNGTVFKTAKAGTLKITSGAYKGELENLGTMIISGGSFYNAYADYYGTGTKVYGTIIDNSGTLTISGGTFTKRVWSMQWFVVNTGKMTISGGEFVSSGYSILNSTQGKLTITGGTFSGDGEYTESFAGLIYNYGSGATIVIKDGTFTTESGAPCIANEIGKTTIYGGTFVNKDSNYYCIYATGGWEDEESVISIKGGTFKSAGDMIRARYGATVKISGGTFKTTGNKSIVLYTWNGGKIKVTGGSFTGKKAYKYAQVTDSTRYGKAKVTISGGTFNTKYGEYTE
ncbi:MAG: hypothetical protein LIP12_17500 [Clostridiales bacterium]|nr:hypothetical protein [Clostridiales bacterium]